MQSYALVVAAAVAERKPDDTPEAVINVTG